MNPGERYLETLLFGRSDKVPFEPGRPREKTLKRWHQEGLPENGVWIDHLFQANPDFFFRVEEVPPPLDLVDFESGDGGFTFRDHTERADHPPEASLGWRPEMASSSVGSGS